MKYQVVILAGGKSSRFFPFNSLHKSFFQLGGKSILQTTISNALKSTKSKIIVVLGGQNFTQEKELLVSYGFGGRIQIVKQTKPLGMADAVLKASKYIINDFFIINAQQLDLDKLATNFTRELTRNKHKVVIGCQKTSTPWKYGVLDFNKHNVCAIVEKPTQGKEPSDMRVVGIYFCSTTFLSDIKRTKLNEYALEDALDILAQQRKLGMVEISKSLPTLKYPWDLLNFKDLQLKNIKTKRIAKSADIAKTATIKGEVIIEANAKVCDYALIEGPAYIGKNVIVGSYCQVRKGSSLEENVILQRYVDVKNSIMGKNSSIHSGFVGDSIIGENVRIGANFVSGNKRLDRGSISVKLKGKKVDSGLTSLGAFIGDNCTLGIGISTMPGAIIKPNSIIYPNTIIK